MPFVCIALPKPLRRPITSSINMDSAVVQSHACLHNPIPKPETQPTLAYDRLQLPVLALHLQHENAEVVHAAVVSLRRLVTVSDAAVKIHEAGLLEILAQKAEQHEASVLEIARMSIECIKLCMQSAALRVETISHSGVVGAIRFCMKSADLQCRSEAYHAIAAAAEFHDAAAQVLAAGFITDIVQRLAAEIRSAHVNEVLVQTLVLSLKRMLSHCDLPVVDAALLENAVAVLFKTLQCAYATKHVEIMSCTADDILAIAVSAAGKTACIAIDGGITHLLSMLDASEPSVLGPVLGCLMNIAIDDDGKKRIVELGAAPLLVKVLLRRDVSISVLLYCCQTISNIACVPGARESIATEDAIKSLTLFKNQRASPALSRVSGVALNALQWAP